MEIWQVFDGVMVVAALEVGGVVGGWEWLWLQRANKHWLRDDLMCQFTQKRCHEPRGGACVDSCWPEID